LGEVTVVSCTDPHYAELFFVTDRPADALYPTSDPGWVQWVRDTCYGPFADYVGIPVEETIYDVAQFWASPQEWSAGLHRVWCGVANIDRSTFDRPVQGIAR
jgi:acyl-coenzyme A synthetase/AMP-(fatty) acid ligase